MIFSMMFKSVSVDWDMYAADIILLLGQFANFAEVGHNLIEVISMMNNGKMVIASCPHMHELGLW